MNFDIRIGTVSFSTETVLEALASLPFDEKRKLVCAMCGVSIMSDEAGCFFAAANSEQAIPPDVAFVEAAARNDPHEEEEEEETGSSLGLMKNELFDRCITSLEVRLNVRRALAEYKQYGYL